jgi:hypothetical protein
MLLKRAVVSSEKIESAKKNKDFYIGQINSANFYISSVIPVTNGKMESIIKMKNHCIEMSDSQF